MNIGIVRRSLAFLTALAWLSAFLPGQEPSTASRQVHYRHREQPSEYHGPEGDYGTEEGLSEVLIGYFGPSDPQHPRAGDSWLAAKMALEEENRSGGYKGLPFRLLSCWSENAWGTGIAKMARMIYSEPVWAILGSIDGPSTHLIEQVAAKARISILNPGSSDKSVNLANVPWMFSCLPGEHLFVPDLTKDLLLHVGKEPFVLISATDHDSRVFVQEFQNELSSNGRSPSYHFEFDPDNRGKLDFLPDVLRTAPAAVLVVGDPAGSASLVRQLREGSYEGSIYGTPAMARRSFIEGTGELSEGVVFPLLVRMEGLERFEHRFFERVGRTPDFAALQTYDAVHFLARVIRDSGLNRMRIREGIRQHAPWAGQAGILDWDPLGQNRRSPVLATLRAGAIRQHSCQALQSDDKSPSWSPR